MDVQKVKSHNAKTVDVVWFDDEKIIVGKDTLVRVGNHYEINGNKYRLIHQEANNGFVFFVTPYDKESEHWVLSYPPCISTSTVRQ